jgi:hypothetical protein
MDLFRPREPADGARIDAMKAWLSELLDVDGDARILVTELRCVEAGCPPLETVIVLLGPPGTTHQLRIHKAMAEVTREDVVAAVANGPSSREIAS